MTLDGVWCLFLQRNKMAKVIVLQVAVCKARHHKRHGKKNKKIKKKTSPLSSSQNYNYT
jgi:hypothetical protein